MTDLEVLQLHLTRLNLNFISMEEDGNLCMIVGYAIFMFSMDGRYIGVEVLV